MVRTDEITNTADVIDSRDVIARIEELEGERENLAIQTCCRHCGQDIEGCESDDEWRDRGNNTSCPDDSGKDHEPPEGTRGELPEDEAAELANLKALADEAEGYAADWHHGEALIRDSYFTEHAQQLAEDCGMVNRQAAWPNNHLDWEAAADELKGDYTAVDFDGTTYWIR